MSSHADPALVDRRSSRAPFRFEHSVRIFILVAVLSLFYPFTSSAADSPPLFLSSSPALRTARDRSTLRPQSASGWYYAEDSRHWYYQLPSSSEARKTGWHHDVDGFTYYFDPSDGHMLSGAHQIDGIEYCFLSERDRGNYHQDHLGAWFYQANGLAPYGSLLSSHARGDHTHSPAAARPADADRDASLIDSSEIVTDRITIPPKASPSELKHQIRRRMSGGTAIRRILPSAASRTMTGRRSLRTGMRTVTASSSTARPASISVVRRFPSRFHRRIRRRSTIRSTSRSSMTGRGSSPSPRPTRSRIWTTSRCMSARVSIRAQRMRRSTGRRTAAVSSRPGSSGC